MADLNHIRNIHQFHLWMAAHLQCPVNWHSLPIVEDRNMDNVSAFVAGSRSWNRFVAQLLLAFSEVVSDRCYHLARKRVTECYLSLLPGPELDPMLEEYKEALKHVVDSLWLWAETNRCEDEHFDGGPDNTDVLISFLKTIKPIESMDRKQRSAVVALRGALPDQYGTDTGGFIRKAIKLQPKEGQWHCDLGNHLQSKRRKNPEFRASALARKSQGAPCVEEITSLRKAVALRRTPESCGCLAVCLLDMDTVEGIQEGLELIKGALVEFPDSKYLQSLAKVVFCIKKGCIPNCRTKGSKLPAEDRDSAQRVAVALPCDVFETPRDAAARFKTTKKKSSKKPSK